MHANFVDAKKQMDKESGVTRLQSLKLPRDFSLGLKLTKNRPQFAPNLNVARNKDKIKDTNKKSEEKRKTKATRGRNNNNNNPNKQHKDRYVQSIGIFSEGSAQVIRRPGPSLERRVNTKEASTSTSTSNIRPTINTNNSWDVSVKKENLVLNELVNCDNGSDEEEVDDSFGAVLMGVPNQNRTAVKDEIDASLNEIKLSSSLPRPFNRDCYTEENSAISLIKLPDSFAGKGLSDDPSNKKLYDYTLDGMLEGQAGKLIIWKSGKMELQVGCVKYQLTEDMTGEQREELVSIVDNGTQLSVSVLGKLVNNFILCPDYDSLLKSVDEK